MRKKALCEAFLGDGPGEVHASKADVEQNATPLGIPHELENLAVVADHLARIVVIDVGYDVAGLRDFEDIFDQRRVRRRLRHFTDMLVERQIQHFGQALGDIQRAGIRQAVGADLEITQDTRVRGRPLKPFLNGDVVQTATAFLETDDA